MCHSVGPVSRSPTNNSWRTLRISTISATPGDPMRSTGCKARKICPKAKPPNPLWTNPRSGSRVRSALIPHDRNRGASAESIRLDWTSITPYNSGRPRVEVTIKIICRERSLRRRTDPLNQKSQPTCNGGEPARNFNCSQIYNAHTFKIHAIPALVASELPCRTGLLRPPSASLRPRAEVRAG